MERYTQNYPDKFQNKKNYKFVQPGSKPSRIMMPTRHNQWITKTGKILAPSMTFKKALKVFKSLNDLVPEYSSFFH